MNHVLKLELSEARALLQACDSTDTYSPASGTAAAKLRGLIAGPVSIVRVPLNRGGYDSRGEYFGVGEPLFHAASEDLSINLTLRAPDRSAAKAQVLNSYPWATFYR